MHCLYSVVLSYYYSHSCPEGAWQKWGCLFVPSTPPVLTLSLHTQTDRKCRSCTRTQRAGTRTLGLLIMRVALSPSLFPKYIKLTSIIPILLKIMSTLCEITFTIIYWNWQRRHWTLTNLYFIWKDKKIADTFSRKTQESRDTCSEKTWFFSTLIVLATVEFFDEKSIFIIDKKAKFCKYRNTRHPYQTLH